MRSKCAQRYSCRFPRTREHIYSQDGADVLFLFIKHVYYPAIGLSNCPTAELLSLWWAGLTALWTTGAGGLIAFPRMHWGGLLFPSPSLSVYSPFLIKVAKKKKKKSLGEHIINEWPYEIISTWHLLPQGPHPVQCPRSFPRLFWDKSHWMVPP